MKRIVFRKINFDLICDWFSDEDEKQERSPVLLEKKIFNRVLQRNSS